MNNPILKSQWERLNNHVVLKDESIKRLMAPYSTEAFDTVTLLSDGCANTNYKVSFKKDKAPVVLRLYTREKFSLLREVALHRLLEEKEIPVPKIYYEDASCTSIDYPYAIMEWIEGVLMRDAIVSSEENEIYDCAFDAGTYLSRLRAITFPKSGFFQEGLTIRPFYESEKYKPFVFDLLQDPIVQEILGVELYKSISMWVDRYSALFPSEQGANLTHGDFDPSNMMVKKTEGKWKVVAILDWEFSFAGSYFWDMGLFLRYAHKLPSCYEEGFIKGVETTGEMLPSTWKLKAKLLDLLSLLQLLQHDAGESRPNLTSDVISLIAHTSTLHES
ncbi:MAG: phosphotransferase family protein [Chthoniobacterales bacterium]